MLKGVPRADNPNWREADIVHARRGETFGGFRNLTEFDEFGQQAAEQAITDYHQYLPPERGIVPELDNLSKRGRPVSDYFNVKALKVAFDFRSPQVIALDADISYIDPQTHSWFHQHRRYEKPPPGYRPVVRGIAGVALVHLTLEQDDELQGVAGIRFSKSLALTRDGRLSDAPLTWHVTTKTGRHVTVADSTHKLFPGLLPE